MRLSSLSVASARAAIGPLGVRRGAVRFAGSAQIHLTVEQAKQLRLVRKRVQPKGTKTCLGCNVAEIAANKSECLGCAQKAGRA
jgi:hypothetical protein